MNAQADKGPSILIVDDDPIVRETLHSLLSREGYDLSIAVNGTQALEKAPEIDPDLILLDVVMPGMDGFTVCQRLRAAPLLLEVPIIMLTGLDDRDSRLKGLQAGADDFIAKPFDWTELRARVRTITGLSQHRRLRTLELQAERDRTRSILEALGEAVVVTDLDGIIEYVNPATVNLTGYSSQEAVGQRWSLWQRDRDTDDLYPRIEETIHTGQTWRGEVVNRRKDGTLYDAILTVAPLFYPQRAGSPSGFVSVQQDITPLKEAERLKDRFVSNVSHELSTPLSVLTLLADNMNTLYERLDDTRRHKMVRDIQKHTQILNDLIDDVLEISRLDSKRISMERQQVNLAELVRDEVERQLPLAQEKKQDCRAVGGQRLMVCGDKIQLQRVIRNLVNNAIKYTPDGGQITCEYTVYAPRVADFAWPGGGDLSNKHWAALRVADTGIGIAHAHIPHLFERFYRVRTQSNVRGTGLGLAIARDLIELHAGHISVASTPGQGSVFAVYLPLPEE